MIKKVLSTILTLSFIFICPLTAFASVATPSDAKRVPVASGSGAVQVFDDFQETDDFDMLDFPALMASGESDLPTVTNTVDYSDLRLYLRYYDMSNSIKYTFVSFN